MAKKYALLSNHYLESILEETKKKLSIIKGSIILESVIGDALNPVKRDKNLNIDRRDALGKNGKLRKSLTIPQWQRKIHDYAITKGWWPKNKKERPIPELLCLLHSEISEALEAYRKGDDDNFKEELADLAIRLFDMAGGLEIDLESEIEKKHEINLKRPFRHGDKKC